ncbi:MAG: hypothetical protein ACI94Y_001466, partial [Maribacter sp.]
KKITLYLLFFSFSAVIFSSCATAIERKDLIKKWKMTKFLQQNQEVSKHFNPNGDRWIQFLDEGTYVAEGGPFPATSGTFTLEDNILHLKSDEGPNEDVNWVIVIKKDKMFFKRLPSESLRGTEIHYERY